MKCTMHNLKLFHRYKFPVFVCSNKSQLHCMCVGVRLDRNHVEKCFQLASVARAKSDYDAILANQKSQPFIDYENDCGK